MNAKTYSLPAKLTAEAISALSMGAFANHSFTNAAGEHITSISAGGMQLRKGDGAPKNIKFVGTPSAQGIEMVFDVKFERDLTW